ncbi:RNA binding protein-like protein, partial [Euroglyphus maynei]
MGPGSLTSVIQVTNVAPVVTNEQLRTFFTNVGPIREFVCYPTSDPSQQISRVCYVRFADPLNVCVAQHLTNTVFIDRAIMVKPVHDNRIPDETLALKLANEGHLQNSSNNGVVSQIETVNGVQSITTIDPRLNALGLPQYPPLSPSLDPAKIEEIRRTIVVSNVNKQTTPEQLLEFFNQFGEVKYLRMTTDENDVIKSAMIEYTDQSSVANALQNTGITFQGSQLNLTHASTSILKPQYKINVDPSKFPETRDLIPKSKRSRSRSIGRSRSSRSPSRSRKSSRRSRTPSHRSRDHKRSSISRSRSPIRRSSRRSRSRERRERSPYSSSSRRRSSRDRSYSRERIRSSRHERSKDRDRRRSSRDRSMERHRSYDRERDRSTRDRERERSERDRKRHDRSREEKDYGHERVHGRVERERSKKRSRSRESERTRLSERRDRRKDSAMASGLIERHDRHNRSRSRSASLIKIMKSPLTGNSQEEDETPMTINKYEHENKLMNR